MALRDTGKQRAARIPLDYFKRRDYLGRLRMASLVIVILATAAWVAFGYWQSDRGVTRYSRGPVAEVHAMWDAECSACHIDFVPLQDNAWTGWTRWTGTELPFGDQKCVACHQGPPHHPNERPDDVSGCSSCHREHQGRQADLTRVADLDCIRCHADLVNHLAGEPTFDPPLAEVGSFDGHPDFRSIESDPGRVKFSHRRHMLPGLTLGPDDKTPPWTLGDIHPSERERYRRAGQSDGAPVQLDCSTCHRLAGDDFPEEEFAGMPAELLTARGDGRYMVPVTYENQCRACHPLAYDPAAPQTNLAPGSPDLIAHRMGPDEIRALLQSTYAKRYLVDEDPSLFDKFVAPRPMPGKPILPEGDKAREWVEAKVDQAERHLRTKCTKCHHLASDEPSLSAVLPSQIPHVWLKHAMFDHSAHRAVTCRECHAAAYPDHPEPSETSKDVLVPGLENCRQCHGRRTRVAGQAVGGARFDCVECHRYHAGDAPFRGTGTARRVGREEFGIPAFLHGDPETLTPAGASPAP